MREACGWQLQQQLPVVQPCGHATLSQLTSESLQPPFHALYGPAAGELGQLGSIGGVCLCIRSVQCTGWLPKLGCSSVPELPCLRVLPVCSQVGSQTQDLPHTFQQVPAAEHTQFCLRHVTPMCRKSFDLVLQGSTGMQGSDGYQETMDSIHNACATRLHRLCSANGGVYIKAAQLLSTAQSVPAQYRRRVGGGGFTWFDLISHVPGTDPSAA